MKIDGVDIAAYGAQQWNVYPAFSQISNNSEWIDGTCIPLMLNSTTGFKKMKVAVLIRGSTRQEIWKQASNLVACLLKPSIIQLDGFEHNYYMYLDNAEEAETSLKRWHKATLEFAGYEYGNEHSVTTAEKELSVINEGNMETPAIIEITPLIGLTSVTITGIVRDKITGEDKPVTVRELTMNKPVILDGETGLINEGGENKFSKVDLWDFPSLLPGENHITVNQDVTIKVTYKPRFM
jgi:hypothetical protein